MDGEIDMIELRMDDAQSSEWAIAVTPMGYFHREHNLFFLYYIASIFNIKRNKEKDVG